MNAAWASVIIAAISLIFLIVCGILGLLWKTAREAGRMGEQIKNAVEDSNKTAQALDQHIRWHMNRRG